MTIPSSQSLIFQVKSTGSELAFIRVLRLGLDNFAFGRLWTSSEVFGLLRKTSDFFGNLQKWSCRLQKSQHSQDKNLTLISQKKLAGIQEGHTWNQGKCGNQFKRMPIVSFFKRLTRLFSFIMVETTIPFHLKNRQSADQWAPIMWAPITRVVGPLPELFETCTSNFSKLFYKSKTMATCSHTVIDYLSIFKIFLKPLSTLQTGPIFSTNIASNPAK